MDMCKVKSQFVSLWNIPRNCEWINLKLSSGVLMLGLWSFCRSRAR